MQCSSYNKYVIIVAGGSGRRMSASVEKQFLPLGESIVLIETLKMVSSSVPEAKIVLVLPIGRADYWRNLCDKYNCRIAHSLVEGGRERFFSVKAAIDSIECSGEKALVAIHDGVRPFADKQIFDECFEKAAECGAAVSCCDCTDSVRYQNKSIDRSEVKLVQTPQCFELSLLQKAYAQTYNPTFTDDASVVESLGTEIALVEGKRENIKLTKPFDFVIAESLINGKLN